MSALRIRVLAAILGLAAAGTVGLAQTYNIDWYTIDGGGVMNSSDGQPGGFELSGTIGQADASSFDMPMSGGGFELVGGFWPVAAQVCTVLADLDLDGNIDGSDVQKFVDCLLTGGTIGGNCACADLDGGGVGAGDVVLFVDALLNP